MREPGANASPPDCCECPRMWSARHLKLHARLYLDTPASSLLPGRQGMRVLSLSLSLSLPPSLSNFSTEPGHNALINDHYNCKTFPSHITTLTSHPVCAHRQEDSEMSINVWSRKDLRFVTNHNIMRFRRTLDRHIGSYCSQGLLGFTVATTRQSKLALLI